jgi:isopropylmalate/homocitrate/citramalate synthase
MNPNFHNIFNYLQFSDSTLREGRQAYGFHLNEGDSLKFIKLIDEMGIEFLELNHPASSKGLQKIIRKAVNLKLKKTNLTTHIRCDLRDIDLALNLGIKNLNLYIPIDQKSDLKVQKSIEKGFLFLEKALDKYKDENLKIRLSLEHSFSINLKDLKKAFLNFLRFKEIKRIGLADTTGSCFPEKVVEYFQVLDKIILKEIDFQLHLHNDHGLAAANFYEILKLASKLERKTIFDLTVFGLGERNGILSYGNIFAILYLINAKKLKNHYAINKYHRLSKVISQAMDKNL